MMLNTKNDHLQPKDFEEALFIATHLEVKVKNIQFKIPPNENYAL